MRNKNGGNEIVRSIQMFKKIYKLPPSPLVLQHLHHQSPRRKTPQRTHHMPSVPFVLTFRKGAIPVTREGQKLFAGLGNIFEDRESSWRRKGRWNLDIFGIAALLICHSDSRSLLQFCKFTEKKIPKILTERTIHMTSWHITIKLYNSVLNQLCVILSMETWVESCAGIYCPPYHLHGWTNGQFPGKATFALKQSETSFPFPLL